ncbi:MAG: hypothetical protein AVDCRST_MAG56-390 [uncultured Cytophagales bacterium]|uniref:Uncharacterized protein n=1 Tax=uncultured Cytophagales bacterium TaxID=158755 RepID=A0A6J4HD40_9SPHI|nr:MAG: hypothetical protein AVDCRST_MAG56-390 [uncultured Cytophagales bacterium]
MINKISRKGALETQSVNPDPFSPCDSVMSLPGIVQTR